MFASTNIDDALVLVEYFANAAEGKDGLQPRHVWIEQFLGFSIIMVLSFVGTFVGSFLPPHYSGLLGFVPLLMGLWRMKDWCKKDKESSGDHNSIDPRCNSTESSVREERTSGQALMKINIASINEPIGNYQLHEVTPKAQESSSSRERNVETLKCCQDHPDCKCLLRRVA